MLLESEDPKAPVSYQSNFEDLIVIEVDVRPCVQYMKIPPGEHSLIPDNLLFNIGKFLLPNVFMSFCTLLRLDII